MLNSLTNCLDYVPEKQRDWQNSGCQHQHLMRKLGLGEPRLLLTLIKA
jgi:hypothetical protein